MMALTSSTARNSRAAGQTTGLTDERGRAVSTVLDESPARSNI
jgi:hypothetical protein